MKNHKWTLVEQGNFLKKTGELLERGYSFSEAIESLLYQVPSNRKIELKKCLEELKEGKPLHAVLSKLKFQRDIIGYMYFADQHGGIIEAISEGSKMTFMKHQNLQKFKKAFFYPTFLFLMTIILFLFVEQTLLPQYFSLHASMGLEVNVFTKFVASVGYVFPRIIGFLGMLIVILLIGYRVYFVKMPLIRQRKFLLKIPFLGVTIRLIQTQYFSLQLGYLLSGGLSLYEALQLFESAPRNAFYRELGLFITEKIKRGETFPEILEEINLFEHDLPFVFKHGQANGKLDKELLFFGHNCLKKLEGNMETSFKLVQPLIYGVIGLLIISMYLSIMLPMFKMLNGI